MSFFQVGERYRDLYQVEHVVRFFDGELAVARKDSKRYYLQSALLQKQAPSRAIQQYRSLNHPLVLPFEEVYTEERSIVFIRPYEPIHPLREVISMQEVNEDQVVQWGKQLLKMEMELQAKPMKMYLLLDPRNIGLTESGELKVLFCGIEQITAQPRTLDWGTFFYSLLSGQYLKGPIEKLPSDFPVSKLMARLIQKSLNNSSAESVLAQIETYEKRKQGKGLFSFLFRESKDQAKEAVQSSKKEKKNDQMELSSQAILHTAEEPKPSDLPSLPSVEDQPEPVAETANASMQTSESPKSAGEVPTEQKEPAEHENKDWLKRVEKETLEGLKQEYEQRQKELLEKQRLELERRQAELLKKQRQEFERKEQELMRQQKEEFKKQIEEPVEQEKWEREQQEKELLEQERLAKEREEEECRWQEELEKKRQEEERKEWERRERDRIEKEQEERLKKELERLEKERLEWEKKRKELEQKERELKERLQKEFEQMMQELLKKQAEEFERQQQELLKKQRELLENQTKERLEKQRMELEQTLIRRPVTKPRLSLLDLGKEEQLAQESKKEKRAREQAEKEKLEKEKVKERLRKERLEQESKEHEELAKQFEEYMKQMYEID